MKTTKVQLTQWQLLAIENMIENELRDDALGIDKGSLEMLLTMIQNAGTKKVA